MRTNTNILIFGDLHGRIPRIHYRDFDAIIAPGDFCSDEAREYIFQAIALNKKNPLKQTTWYDLAGRVKAKDYVKKSLSKGRKVLNFLDSLGVPVFVVPGNWDWTPNDTSDWSFLRQNHFESLLSGLTNVHNVYQKKTAFRRYDIIGYGISSKPEYPQHEDIKQSYSKEQLATLKKQCDEHIDWLSSLFLEAKNAVIFISHNVPFNTPLDIIINPQSPLHGYHFGSIVARTMVDLYQPIACIGGHIHEHYGSCRLNNTTVINSGFGADANVLLRLSSNEIAEVRFNDVTR